MRETATTIAANNPGPKPLEFDGFRNQAVIVTFPWPTTNYQLSILPEYPEVLAGIRGLL